MAIPQEIHFRMLCALCTHCRSLDVDPLRVMWMWLWNLHTLWLCSRFVISHERFISVRFTFEYALECRLQPKDSIVFRKHHYKKCHWHWFNENAHSITEMREALSWNIQFEMASLWISFVIFWQIITHYMDDRSHSDKFSATVNISFGGFFNKKIIQMQTWAAMNMETDKIHRFEKQRIKIINLHLFMWLKMISLSSEHWAWIHWNRKIENSNS